MPVRTHPASHRVIATLAQQNRAPSALGALALDNPYGALALDNGSFLGFGGGRIFGFPVTKKERHSNAVGNEAKFRNKYMECKTKFLNKGLTVFPEGKKCKTKYNKWQRWRGKAGERAMKVAEAAEKKGRLDPEAKAFLDADIERAMDQDPNEALAMSAAMSDEEADAYMAETYSVGTPWGAIAAAGGLGIAALAVGYLVMTRK